MRIYSKPQETGKSAESGFILVLAMVMLLLLSSFGIWALRTSTSEMQVAGGSQQIETQFNVTEGGAYAEALKVGFSLPQFPFYQVNNPNTPNQILIPLTDGDAGPGDFDPGGHAPNTPPQEVTLANFNAADMDTWPWENLQPDYANNNLDYRYLTTFLYSDTPPMGYDAAAFAAYKFRIVSSAASLPLSVELGGTKIGPKS